jgi:hypothetical protein
MSANISFQPFQTSNVLGSFSISSEGFNQGVALDDPAVRFALAGGPLAASETLPMWGGVGISESIPASTANAAIGSSIGRATSNQASAWVTSPQSECPSAGVGTTVPYYRFGSGARIALAIDPSLISLDGGLITQSVAWDFNNQRLAPVGTGVYTLTSIVGTYNAATGLWTMQVTAAAPTLVGAVGDAINISGVTGTGAGLVNGNQVVTQFTSNESFQFQIAAASGAIGTLAGTQVLNTTSVALGNNFRILKLNVGNSKIVSYDAVNNLVHWTNNGSTAIALI